jgi:uncharacterized membrane protein YvbJ
MRYCDNCGSAIKDTDAFCGKCGKIAMARTNMSESITIKYCDKCGNAMKAKDAFCGKCGKAPQEEQSSSIDFSGQAAVIPSHNNKHSLLPWIIILLLVLIGGVIGGYFFFANSQQMASSDIVKSNNSASSASQNVSTKASSKLTADALNDFRVYVQTKERLNTEIIDLAGQVNNRIGQTGGLRSSQDLKNRAQSLAHETEQISKKLSGKTYPAELQGAKTLLLQLFDLEMTRVQSLYNGITEGLNGQDYSKSFSSGTSAAYKFDEVNDNFIQENNLLDNKVGQ